MKSTAGIRSWRKAALAAAIAGFCISEAAAQGLEEVVVTAQRRSASVQDTPVAITGLGSDSLEKLGFESANDIGAQVPNMQVSGPYGEVQPIFSIRGVSMSDYSSNQASPIGVYTDEAYLPATFSHGMSFFDVERLEVLRGPQGTLYGKNTTGGAINIITNTPQIGDDWAGKLKVGGGSYGMETAEGAVGGTLIDNTLAARVAFKYKRDDGYFENTLGGPDLAQTDFFAARIALNWQITDSLGAVLKYTRGRNDSYATPPRNEPRTDIRGMENLNPTAPYPTNSGYMDYTGYDRNSRNLSFWQTEDNRALDNESNLNVEFDLAILTMSYDADNFQIVSVTSYNDADYTQLANTDGSPLRLLEIDWHTDTQTFSQDLRFVSDFGGMFSIVAGAYIAQEETWLNNKYSLFEDLVDFRTALAKPAAAGQAPFILDFGVLDQRQETVKDSAALYTQMRFDFTGNFGMDLGIRYTEDKSTQPYLNISRLGYDGTPRGTFVPGNTGYDQAFVPLSLPAGVAGGDINSILAFLADPGPYLTQITQNGLPGFTDGPYTMDSAKELEATEKEFTGKLGLDYRFNDALMVYGSYSKGYRAGSFNGGIYYSERPLETSYASPEYIDAYELGFKTDLLDNSLRINGAFFFYEYTDQQFINVVGISNFLENAGGSEIMGFEAEVWWAATDDLVVQLGVGIIESEYTELELRNIETLDDNNDTVDLTGNELISAPPLNVSLSFDYDIYKNDYGYLSVNANANFQDDQWFSAYNDAAGHEFIRQDAYWIYNARMSWYANDETWSAAVWVKNLTEEEYDTYAINLQASFGFDYYSQGAPRTWGAEVTYNF
ncbi:TonB-dependent receptor [Spongiibacter sp. KMU-158]|uniref:TonB-dependent receptor n=1 Tax=Spongiibacter pelagi TaxID=2760804 RepID=A0A927C2A8_9GAMM|nr:TonB-dependent receptor [Spongiibacter pelagi]MBD2859449.1 TonB-dependent receptor [Spongiibacter pelagi]